MAEIGEKFKITQNIFDTIINNLPEAIIAYDKDFKITIFNRAAEEIFNLKLEEVINRDFSVNLVKDPKFRLLVQVLFPSLVPTVIRYSPSGVYPQIIDIILEEPALSLRTLTEEVREGEGNIAGFIKLIKDRTRELELKRSKSEFIGIIADQLQTPLKDIDWSLEALKNQALSDKAIRLAEAASQTTKQLLDTAEKLLNVAKIEEGKFGYEFTEIDLGEFLEKILSEAMAVAKEYKVNIYFDKPKEEIKITADAQKLAMALSSLLDNAIKYNMTNGQIIVKLERLNKSYVQVSIQDTGVGILPEEINKIFTKFFRAQNIKESRGSGTGLGLYITKNIIKRHGGEIWVESVFQRGTTFYFTLPTDPDLIPSKEIVYEEE